MARRTERGLTKRKIDAEKPHATKEQKLWDDDPKGLFLRIKPNGEKTFGYQYTSPTTFKKRRKTIGAYGTFTLAQARSRAKELALLVERRLDPLDEDALKKETAAKSAKTLKDFAKTYMDDARAGRVRYRGRPKKESTLKIDQGRVDRHIVPLLGNKQLREVTGRDVEDFFHDIRDGKTAALVKTKKRGLARVTGGETTASRTVDLVGSIFSYAIKQGLVTSNPVTGFERPQTRRRNRVLNQHEYRRLEQALVNLETSGGNKRSIAAIRTLALTGCRRNEIYCLKISETDLARQCFRFEDTKTGQQIRPIGKATVTYLSNVDFGHPEWMFPASHSDAPLQDNKTIKRVCEAANLKNVTLHTLRHSFATVALEEGFSELVVAGLLGHSRATVTSNYAHPDRAMVVAADRVSQAIWNYMQDHSKAEGQVVQLERAR